MARNNYRPGHSPVTEAPYIMRVGAKPFGCMFWR